MKFTKIKKRKVYNTWQHKNRETGLVSYIFYLPNGNYHFHISCFRKRCGLERCIKDECNKYVSYNSLEEGLFFGSFDECREAVVKWHRVRG